MNLIEQLGGSKARHKSRTGVAGVGYNTSNIPTKVNGKHTPEYVMWREMLRRCYSKSFQKKCPQYTECYVCERWHNFMNFYNDIIKMKGYEHISTKRWVNLDKDIILKGNKVYSPDLCRLVPQEINKLITNRRACRGDLPIGVTFSKSKGKYVASLGFIKGTPIKGNVFDKPNDAFLFYKKHKESHIKNIITKFKDALDVDVFNALNNYEVSIND